MTEWAQEWTNNRMNERMNELHVIYKNKWETTMDHQTIKSGKRN